MFPYPSQPMPPVTIAPDFTTFWLLQGFTPVAFTDTTITYTSGTVRNINNNLVMQAPNTAYENIVINSATIGAFGVWPNALSVVAPVSGVSLLPVFQISDSLGTNVDKYRHLVQNALMVYTGSDFPLTITLPQGYDSASLVGFVPVNSSANFVPFVEGGLYNRRNFAFQDPVQILLDGAATTQTPVSLGAVGGTLGISGSVASVDILYEFTAATAGDIAYLVSDGLTPTSVWPVQIQAATTTVTQGVLSMVPGAAGIDYMVTAGGDSLTLWVTGMTIDIPFSFYPVAA
jgi:hypothetical protein